MASEPANGDHFGGRASSTPTRSSSTVIVADQAGVDEGENLSVAGGVERARSSSTIASRNMRFRSCIRPPSIPPVSSGSPACSGQSRLRDRPSMSLPWGAFPRGHPERNSVVRRPEPKLTPVVNEGGVLLQFRILGPLEVVRGEECLAFRGRRERAVLALLVLNANRTVSAERLAEDLWSGDPPEGAIHSLRVYVSRLRQALGSAAQAVVTRPSGYALQVDASVVDAVRFEELVARGRDEAKGGDHTRAATTLREALALWRGPALADVADAPFARAQAGRLEEARLCALEDRIEADLACGRHGEGTAELEALTREHPFRERLWSQRMVALYRSGRQADALRAYQELRLTLGEQLGIEPSSALQQLEGAVLRHDPELDWHQGEAVGPLATAPRSGEAGTEVVPSLATAEPGRLPRRNRCGAKSASPWWVGRSSCRNSTRSGRRHARGSGTWCCWPASRASARAAWRPSSPA